MRYRSLLPALLPALLLALVAVGCDGHDHDHDHDNGHDHGEAHKDGDHDHDHDDKDHAHAHAAKYGGKLVELGEHEFQVELVAYPETGVMEAYIFDGCVERAIPTAMAVLKVEAQVGEETVALELKPDANPYADEVAGKATKFKGQHDKLKKQDHFDGKLVEVSVAGKTFKDVEFHYHIGGDHDHDHDH